MSSKMQVLFVKQTGHVLAAFTRAADPEGKLKVEDLVGTALPVRAANDVMAATSPEPLFVPSDSLDIATVDLEEEALVAPSSFIASGTKLDALGGIVPGQPALAYDKITITTANNVAQSTKVWAQIQQTSPPLGEEPISRVVEGEIISATKSVELVLKRLPDKQPASIPDGSYDALILIAGQQPFFSRLTVPPLST
jgi:hypothetical protein